MARSVSSFFLIGAVIYTALLLLAAQPRSDVVLVPVHPWNETVKAKQPLMRSAQSVILQVARSSVVLQLIRDAVQHVAEKTSTQDTASDETTGSLPPLSRPALHNLREGEWAEVVGYMAIARAEPKESAPVLAGYPVGQPFRVIGRKGTFIRVQDLRSGQLGWIDQTSLAHYSGYARHATPPPIMIASAPAPTPVQEIENSTMPEPQVVAALPKPVETARATPSHIKPFALGPADEPAKVDETPKRGLFMQVAARHEGDGFDALMQRAFSGY
jgi:hypothetical protein